MSPQTDQILIYSENPGLLRELAGKARRVADGMGWEVSALSLNSETGRTYEDLASGGIDRVYEIVHPGLKDSLPEACAEALEATIKEVGPKLVLVGATKNGLEIAPRVAERTQSAYAAWVVDFSVEPASGQVTARSMVYGGMGASVNRFAQAGCILSVAPGVFDAGQEQAARTMRILSLEVTLSHPALEVLGYREKPGGSSRWEEARAIVDVGQGVKQKEDLAMIAELAQLVGGQMACSRPVAAERDWFPEWLGLSGKKVKPRLCITVGISGAIQHIVGIRDSQVIVAINNDENAGVFSQADYGVVADLYEFLPVLIEKMKNRNIHLA